MVRNWDSTSKIVLKISFLSDKSDTYVSMVLVSYNLMACAFLGTKGSGRASNLRVKSTYNVLTRKFIPHTHDAIKPRSSG
jgi:hypothetical protein